MKDETLSSMIQKEREAVEQAEKEKDEDSELLHKREYNRLIKLRDFLRKAK